jgi:hypothetical protein
VSQHSQGPQKVCAFCVSKPTHLRSAAASHVLHDTQQPALAQSANTPEQLPLMVAAHTPPVPHAMLWLPANPAAHAPAQDTFTSVPLQLTGQAPLASSALGVVVHLVAAAARHAQRWLRGNTTQRCVYIFRPYALCRCLSTNVYIHSKLFQMRRCKLLGRAGPPILSLTCCILHTRLTAQDLLPLYK